MNWAAAFDFQWLLWHILSITSNLVSKIDRDWIIVSVTMSRVTKPMYSNIKIPRSWEINQKTIYEGNRFQTEELAEKENNWWVSQWKDSLPCLFLMLTPADTVSALLSFFPIFSLSLSLPFWCHSLAPFFLISACPPLLHGHPCPAVKWPIVFPFVLNWHFQCLIPVEYIWRVWRSILIFWIPTHSRHWHFRHLSWPGDKTPDQEPATFQPLGFCPFLKKQLSICLQEDTAN